MVSSPMPNVAKACRAEELPHITALGRMHAMTHTSSGQALWNGILKPRSETTASLAFPFA